MSVEWKVRQLTDWRTLHPPLMMSKIFSEMRYEFKKLYLVYRFLGLFWIIKEIRVLMGSWVLIGPCILIGSWVLIRSWVLSGSLVLCSAFPVCLEIKISIYRDTYLKIYLFKNLIFKQKRYINVFKIIIDTIMKS